MLAAAMETMDSRFWSHSPLILLRGGYLFCDTSSVMCRPPLTT